MAQKTENSKLANPLKEAVTLASNWNYLLYIDTQLASSQQTESPGRPKSLLAGLPYRVLMVNMLYKIFHGDRTMVRNGY